MRLTPALAALLALCAPARAAERAADPPPALSLPSPAAPTTQAIPQLPQGLAPPAGVLQAATLPQAAALPDALPAGAPALAPLSAPAASLLPAQPGAPALAAQEQLRGLGSGAGEIRGALGPDGAAGGAESGKGLSDQAFDRSARLPGGDGVLAASTAAGSGAGEASRGDYRAALKRLRVPEAAVAALERARGGKNARLAAWASALAGERSEGLAPAQRSALLASALLQDALPAARARAIREAAAAGWRAAPLDAAWRSRLDHLAAVVAAGDDAARLAPLSRDQRFAYLPRALAEDVSEALRFHAPAAVDARSAVASDAAAARGPPSAAALVKDGLSSGLIGKTQAEDWLRAAYQDPLTGLPNRLYLEDHRDQLVSRSRTLVTFKLDSLKEVNDALDHEAGNTLLQAVAAVTRGTLGEDAAVVRRSPTGFALFLDAPPEDALLVGEALRSAVEQQLGPLERVLKTPAPGAAGTVSVGEAAIDETKDEADAFSDALERAETARSFAKDVGGGDRTAVDGADGPRLAERRTPSEIVARLRQRPGMAPLAARYEETRRAPLSKLTAELASKAVDASRLVEQAPPQLKDRLFSVLYRDRLSGLRNRRWLFDHLAALFRPGGVSRYVALDLDHFGAVNETLGEERADLMLKELGALLEEQAGKHGAVALHLSGEEFALLADDRVDADALAEEVREQVQAKLGERAKARFGLVEPGTDRPLKVTVSLGVARVKPESSPQPSLTLATAMAEAMLQRAKEGGRNRVESEDEQADLLARLSRLIRVDQKVRDAVDRLFPGPEGKPPAHPFDNRFKTRAEVSALLGYDPAWQRGALLSAPEKAGSYVARVTPPGKPGVVVKIAREETIVNEMAMRAILESFEYFSESLRAPRAAAYRRWLLRPVMVMEDVPNHNPAMTAADLPLPQRAALAMFALTFGVHDLNPGAFLQVGWNRTVLTDFERARSATSVPPKTRFAAYSEMAWVSTSYLNDMSDFRPAFERWRAAFARPAAIKEIGAILRRSGVPEGEIPGNIALFADNLKRLPEVLQADIDSANARFIDEARRVGLTPSQAVGLSELNHSAHRSPDGGVLRDVARALLGRDPRRGPFSLDPEEAAALARRKGAFSRGTLESLTTLAQNGGLFALDGRLIGPLRARQAFEQLARLLAP